MYHEECEILIVEDNPTDAELMVRSLRKNRLANTMTVVEDGEQALDFLFCRGNYSGRNMERLPRVVFLDLKLPKIDGLDVLRQVKADERTKKIPIIIVSSSREDPDIERAYSLGANSYVVKPVGFEDFMEKVNQLGMYWLVVNEKPT